jgi:hypothetical protein
MFHCARHPLEFAKLEIDIPTLDGPWFKSCQGRRQSGPALEGIIPLVTFLVPVLHVCYLAWCLLGLIREGHQLRLRGLTRAGLGLGATT